MKILRWGADRAPRRLGGRGGAALLVLLSGGILFFSAADVGIEAEAKQKIVLRKDYPGLILILTETETEALRLLASGRHDGALVTKTGGRLTVKRYGLSNLTTTGPPMLPVEYSFAVLEGRAALLQQINQGLSALRETEAYDELRKKWFGDVEPRPAGFLSVLSYAFWVLAPLVLIALLALAWSWTLRKKVAERTRELDVQLKKRLKAEEALRKSEALLNSTQELTQVGGWEWDVDRQSMYWTREVYRIHGFRPDEIPPGSKEHIDRSIECYDPGDRPVILGAFQRCAEEGEPYDLEVPFSPVDGRRLWIRTTARPVFKDGRVVRVFGNIMDITDRKEADLAVRESRRRLATLIGNLNGLVYRCRNDRDWTMEFVSEGCETLTGYRAEDLLGNRKASYADLIHPDDRERIWDEVQAAVEKKSAFHLEYRIRTQSGKEKSVWEQGCAVFSDDGKIEALEGFIVDVTEQRKAAEEITKLNLELEDRVKKRTAQLEAANRELEAFSYSVSHDLRAPLRAIAGFTEILHRDYGSVLDEEGRRVCSVIADNAVRLGRLIDALLELSRFSRIEMRLSPVDMRALAVSAYEELAAPEMRGRVRFHVGDLGKANADPILIRQVLVNLLSNALKFSSRRDRPSVSVTRSDEKRQAVFCVRDNGVGFNMRYADKLFKVFQRLHGEKEFSGTGVGLAIVQRIISRHGGRIWAEGETDKGASFFFTLTVRKQEGGGHDRSV